MGLGEINQRSNSYEKIQGTMQTTPVPHKDILFILQLASGIGSLFSGFLTELEKCFLNEAEILPTSTDIRFHAVCHSPEDMSDLALVSFCFALIDHMLAFI